MVAAVGHNFVAAKLWSSPNASDSVRVDMQLACCEMPIGATPSAPRAERPRRNVETRAACLPEAIENMVLETEVWRGERIMVSSSRRTATARGYGTLQRHPCISFDPNALVVTGKIH